MANAKFLFGSSGSLVPACFVYVLTNLKPELSPWPSPGFGLTLPVDSFPSSSSTLLTTTEYTYVSVPSSLFLSWSCWIGVLT